MNKKSLFALLSISLASTAVGSGIGPLIPLFAVQLGANADQIGFLFAAAFAGLAGGFLAAGRFSNQHAYRKPLLVTAAALAVGMNWLIGRSVNMSQLMLFSVAATFLDGIQLALVNTLAGLHAGGADRGRVFGLLGSMGSLGVLLSGLAGSVVLRWGFPGLFTTAALFKLWQTLSALLVVDTAQSPAGRSTTQGKPAEYGEVVLNQQKTEIRLPRSILLSRAFVFLFFASVIAFATGGSYGLARSLWMARSGFDAAAISSTVAIGGMVMLPFPLLMGWLSDRIGRRPLLLLCYVAGAASLFILALSTQLWQIWVASALQAMLGVSLGIGAALVTDLVPAKKLGSGLSLYGSSNWIGLIVGSVLTGAVVQRLGFTPTLLSGGLLALLTVALVIPIRRQVSQLPRKPGASLAHPVLVLKEEEK